MTAMANFDGSDAGSTGGMPAWQTAGAGAVAGGAAVAGYGWAQSVGKRALVGEVVSIGVAGMSVLQGNTAVNSSNLAMAGINGVVGTTYATDIPAIKAAIQNLAIGLANNTPQGYLGISTLTAALPTPSSAIPAAPSATGALIAVALVVGAVLLLK